MRRLLFAFILACVLILTVGKPMLLSAPVKEAMPDLKAATVLQEPIPYMDCGTVILWVGAYDTDGDLSVSEIDAFFLEDDLDHPFAAVYWQDSELLRVVVDLDRDGYVDASGQPGEPMIGDGPCDPAMEVIARKKP